jgi:hypothetical protein
MNTSLLKIPGDLDGEHLVISKSELLQHKKRKVEFAVFLKNQFNLE